ncbi:MAG: hypothetical protein NW201_01885 [Gemmatimonadales bacterium]|nr:hypothetical protein [Gemmatimonadales bacterium]
MSGWRSRGLLVALLLATPAAAHAQGHALVVRLQDLLFGEPLEGRAQLALYGDLPSDLRRTTQVVVLRFDRRPDSVGLALADPILDSLGIASPIFELRRPRDGDTVTVTTRERDDLRAELCGGAGVPGTGVLVGVVLDTLKQQPAAAIPVEVSGAGALRTTTTDATGRFVLCDLPPDIVIGVRVRGPASEVTQQVQLARAPFFTRAILLLGGPPATTWTLRGTVRAGKRPITGARIREMTTGATATAGDGGRFTLPVTTSAGDGVLEATAIGFRRRLQPVRFSARLGPIDLVLDSATTVLPEVVTEAERPIALADPEGFRERQRAGFGTIMDDKEVAKRAGLNAYDVLQNTNGLEVGLNFIESSRRTTLGTCTPQLFVDGNRRTDALGSAAVAARTRQPIVEYLQAIPKGDIAGIEVYPNGLGAPAWASGSQAGCGVVLVWTKQHLEQ